MITNKPEHIGFKCDKELKAKINELAKENRRSASQQIILMLESALEKEQSNV